VDKIACFVGNYILPQGKSWCSRTRRFDEVFAINLQAWPMRARDLREMRRVLKMLATPRSASLPPRQGVAELLTAAGLCRRDQ
jgi:hypothetical protein